MMGHRRYIDIKTDDRCLDTQMDIFIHAKYMYIYIIDRQIDR